MKGDSVGQQYVFVDDSGDPGLSKTSSSRFIVAAVIVADRLARDELTLIIDKYRRSLGWHEYDEFKFNKTRKSVVKELIEKAAACDFSAYAIVIDKTKLASSKTQADLYNETIKELLLLLPLENPVITIDGRSNKHAMRQMATDLRQAIKSRGRSVKLIKFDDSHKNSLIQLAYNWQISWLALWADHIRRVKRMPTNTSN